MVTVNEAREVGGQDSPLFIRSKDTIASPVEGTYEVRLQEGEVSPRYAAAILASQEESHGVFRFLSEEDQEKAESLRQKIMTYTGDRTSPRFVAWSRDLNELHSRNNRAAMEAISNQN